MAGPQRERRRAVLGSIKVSNSWALRAAGGVLFVLFGGCAKEPAPAGFLPAGPAIVDVVEHDYSYTLGRQGQLPAGRTVFRISNRSALDHDLSLVAVPEDVPPILDQLRSADRRAVATLARLPSRPRGTRDAFAVELTPGRYALLCFENDPDGQTHALKGMAVEFRVASPPAKRAAGR